MELSPYKTLLNKLVTLSYHNDIDGLLDHLLPEADKDTRYQLQAEVNRLTSPCLRVLDLRSLFPEKCQLVRHQGLDHMMPEPLVRRFHALLKDYNGEYTRGLYEVLLAELAALRKLPAQFNSIPWQLPAQGVRRKESRLRFVTPVVLHLDNDETLQGNTLDISANGLLVQLAQATRLPEQLGVSFPELAKQANMSCLAAPSRYQLKQDTADLGRLKMQRADESPDSNHALSEFIKQQRPRYGLDAEDIYMAVQVQCWGQALLETSLSMPLFANEKGELIQALTNRYNSKLLTAWQQENPGDLLTTLLSPERILYISQQPAQSTLLYSFVHQGKQQSYYFVASLQELVQANSYAAFLSEGLRAGTLRCYYINIHALNYNNQIADGLDLQGVRQLQQLKWQLWLTPLPAPTPPAAEIADGFKIQQLASFIRPLCQQQIKTTPLGRQASKRQETRFKLQSALELTLGGKVIEGCTEDLSTRGIKVQLAEPVRLEVPCLVDVHLTELNKRSPQWRLKTLPYRVVNVSSNSTVLHLRIEGPEENHAAYLFLTALFEQNQDKLRARPEAHHTPAWLIWLCRQALQQPPSPIFLLGRNEAGFYMQGAIANLQQPSLVSLLSDSHQQAHFSRLVSRQLLQSTFSQLLRPDGRTHHFLEIWTAKTTDTGQAILLVAPDADRRAFLQDTRYHSELRVSLVVINRLKLRQLNYMVPEWATLTQTSLHKTQQLEQQLAELALLSQVFDITDMVQPSKTRAPKPAPLQG
ncbi:PilZ domain-containing protein [Oceanisphaera pacifica]|uniref:PilZ domain-containing protein n=1 Tax=Oceanisphaera pacifica TaxID=2818389 RepID=A0ABS3NCL1_9GAMM|nr:PilZ domain-containing protein [Oceanisphaera pacifica]MBO1518339.1 PilZ domain-containing protein [Oceanisphaera pacifica]